MRISLTTLLATLSSIFRSRAALGLENLALRHQIGVLQRSARHRPKLTSGDRLLWICLSRLWRDWRSALAIVKPETVVAWHRAGFRLFWTWKVRRGQPGRPVISLEIRDLIRKMCRENPSWGAPRIHGELLKLGIDIGESSVSKYMVRCRKPPSQTWRTFLENHAQQLVSIDFFTVPTIRFQVLYVFVVLAHERRRILHFNVTAHPTAEWTGQQLREAFPFDQLPRYLLRDRDAIFGNDFRGQVRDMGICEVLSAPRSPWQRAYVERVIGSIRRECLDHVIVFHENSLRRTLNSYFDYYHRSRTHLSLGKDSPEPRAIQAAGNGVRRVGAAGWWTAPPLRTTGCLKTPASTTLRAASPCGFEICVRTVLSCKRVHRRISFTRLKQGRTLFESTIRLEV
jgi:putative transposase